MFNMAIIFLPQIRMTRKMIRFIIKLEISDRKSRLADSLSVFGRTIASSYLKVVKTVRIPIILRYTSNVPKVSGEKMRARIGRRIIEIS
jgi:hypothetical protein